MNRSPVASIVEDDSVAETCTDCGYHECPHVFRSHLKGDSAAFRRAHKKRMDIIMAPRGVMPRVMTASYPWGGLLINRPITAPSSGAKIASVQGDGEGFYIYDDVSDQGGN